MPAPHYSDTRPFKLKHHQGKHYTRDRKRGFQIWINDLNIVLETSEIWVKDLIWDLPITVTYATCWVNCCAYLTVGLFRQWPNQRCCGTQNTENTSNQWRRHSYHTHTNTLTCLTALCPGLTGYAGTRKVKPIWILLKQETVSGSGTSWATCRSAPRSRQINTPAPHHSVFYSLDALPAAQPTASKHWRHIVSIS